MRLQQLGKSLVRRRDNPTDWLNNTTGTVWAIFTRVPDCATGEVFHGLEINLNGVDKITHPLATQELPADLIIDIGFGKVGMGSFEAIPCIFPEERI